MKALDWQGNAKNFSRKFLAAQFFSCIWRLQGPGFDFALLYF
jgi:hypothetical protein